MRTGMSTAPQILTFQLADLNSMQQTFTVENVRTAVQVLFQTTTQHTKQELSQADDYLKSFGKSVLAWSIAIHILKSPNEDKALHIQMARVLKTKWEYDFVSLKPNEIKEVYAQTIDIIKVYAASVDRVMRVQISLTLIYMYMHTLQQFGTNDLLDFLLTELKFTAEPTLTNLQKFCFDVLEAWPEEVTGNEKIVIDEQKRELLKQSMKVTAMSRVFGILQKLWVAADQGLQYHILRTYRQWVLFVKQVLERDEALQYLRVCNECPVFLGALDSLKKEELQEKAIDLITQVISLIPKDLTDLILFTQSPEMAMLNAIVQRIIESAFLTFPQCRIAIQDELSDEVEQYVTFYSKIGKRFIHQILQLPQLTLPFLEMMLLLLQSNESDDRIVTLKLFWDKLFKTIEVYQARDNRPIELGSVWKVLAVTCFKKCVVSVKYLLHYAAERKEKTVEEDLEDGELSDPEDIDNANEEYETKLDVRKQVREIILAMVAATDPKVLVLLLKEEVKNFAPLFTPENLALEFKDLPPIAQQQWAQFEALLYITNALIHTILLTDDLESKTYLMELMYMYSRLKHTNPFIVKTTLRTIADGGGSLLQIQKDLIQLIFEYVFRYLQSPRKSIAKLASKAFLKICQFNHDFVLNNLSVFITLLQNVPNLDLVDNLIKGVSNAVCSSNQTVLQYFVPLCSVFALNLATIQGEIQSQQNQEQPITKNQIEDNKQLFRRARKSLDAITMVIINIEADEDGGPTTQPIQQIVLTVYQQLWPILKYLVQEASALDGNLAEKVVRLTKHTWRRTFNTFDVVFLTEVLKTFIEVYRVRALSSFIYSIEVIATVFSKYADYQQVLIEAFEMVCDITFMHLPKLSSFEENPDLTEDFFGMLLRYGRYSPQLLLQSKSLGTILQLTEIGIGVKHHHAAKAIYGWIEVLCKMQSSTKHPDFHSSIPVEQIQRQAQILIAPVPMFLQKVFREIREGISDEEVASYIFDVVFAIANLESIEYSQLLSQILSDVQVLTPTETTEWIRLMSQRTFDEAQVKKQSEYLHLLNKRSIQHSMRQ